MDKLPAGAILSRPGLPIDPILQLGVGEVVVLPSVTWTGGSADVVAGPNPNRVALYLWRVSGAAPWTVVPAPGPAAVGLFISTDDYVTVLHCRDYPGLTQGGWVGSGNVGEIVAVAEYVLQPWWGV